jgi:hypothetical protein
MWLEKNRPRISRDTLMIVFTTQNTHKAEVPLEVRIGEGRDERSRGSVNMDINRESFCLILLAQKPIHFLDILILTSVSSTKDGANKNGVLIN